MASDNGVETIEMVTPQPPPPTATEPAARAETAPTVTTTLIVTPPPGERMPSADEAHGITIVTTTATIDPAAANNTEIAKAPPPPTNTAPLQTMADKRLASDGGALTLAIGHQDGSGNADVATKFIPALPSSTQHIFHQAAAAHGGDETQSFLQQESQASAQLHHQQQQQVQQQQQQRLRSASSTLDASVSRQPSAAARHEKKIGHRRVDEGGEVTYKKIQSKQIMGSIQLGIQHTVGILASKPKRDLLMKDFWEMETISFPPDGSSLTPAHHYSDFRFKVYAPIAFRYFRDLFGIAPDDFLMSLCAAPLRQLSNPGASGSIFYLTNDDEFIIKTVQKKECEFLQKLLPGYYMNLSQNPRTLLPKFFGLYCFHYNTKNVRLVAMNNLLPSEIKMHAKYDLKGSTFRRKASKAERQKASPTFKDLDFMDHYPNGIFLETDKYNALMNTIRRDCMVLESFQIMDYSLLVGVHNLDMAQKEKREERIRNARAKLQRSEEIREVDDAPEADQAQITPYYGASTSAGHQAAGTALNRSRSMNRQRLVAHSTAMESITADVDMPLEEDEDVPAGGIPARSENDDRLILYIGIIDILQSYRFEKKLEHTFKSIIYNGDTVSVCRPSFYAQRFQNFMAKTVFKKTPTFLKRKPSSTPSSRGGVQRTPSQGLMSQGRPTLMSGSSTPPPAFDDISEEDMTASSSNGISGGGGVGGMGGSYGAHRMYQPRVIFPASQMSSSTNNEYSDDDLASSSDTRSPAMQRNHRPRLSKTDVQLTTIGCPEEEDEEQDSGTEDKRRHFSQSNSTTSSIQPSSDMADANGKPVAMKTVKAPLYTTTLVLNDVR